MYRLVLFMILISILYSKMQHSCSYQDAVRFETPTNVTPNPVLHLSSLNSSTAFHGNVLFICFLI